MKSLNSEKKMATMAIIVILLTLNGRLKDIGLWMLLYEL
jgi:hypothetical protein